MSLRREIKDDWKAYVDLLKWARDDARGLAHEALVFLFGTVVPLLSFAFVIAVIFIMTVSGIATLYGAVT